MTTGSNHHFCRNQIKISEDMPMRFQTVEDWFFPRFLLCPCEIERTLSFRSRHMAPTSV